MTADDVDGCGAGCAGSADGTGGIPVCDNKVGSSNVSAILFPSRTEIDYRAVNKYLTMYLSFQIKLRVLSHRSLNGKIKR